MSTDGQCTERRRNIAENYNRLHRVHKRYRQTDRQTDRRTDGRQQFMFAKKEVSGEAKQTMYIAPKSTNESRAHNAHSLHGTPF